MTTVLLVRHGRTTANATGLLAGRTPGIHLDERGREQVERLGGCLAALPIDAVVSSPLERTMETSEALLVGAKGTRPLHLEEGLIECGYGDWTGHELKVLAKDPLWKIVQSQPSAVKFPGDEGEPMLTMQHRAVAAIRRWNVSLGPRSMYVAVSHGDVIKAILADALGMHLDQFQRIHVDPASVSVVNYSDSGTSVFRMNDSTADLSALVRPSRRKSKSAPVGGGAG
jgi:probable phosphomutase (TIGR03848 family)